MSVSNKYILPSVYKQNKNSNKPEVKPIHNLVVLFNFKKLHSKNVTKIFTKTRKLGNPMSLHVIRHGKVGVTKSIIIL